MKLSPNSIRTHLFVTRDPFSGVLANAVTTPTLTIYRNGTSEGGITSTIASLSTGLYKYSYTVDSGWTADDVVNDVISATVAGLAGIAVYSYTIDATITSRLDSSSYQSPDNASIASISLAVEDIDSTINSITTGSFASSDSLPALRAAIDALTPSAQGDVAVNHDTGGTDALAYQTPGGAGIADADVFAYLKSDYDAGHFSPVGHTTTVAAGRWLTPIYLNTGSDYTLVFSKPGIYGPDIQTLTL